MSVIAVNNVRDKVLKRLEEKTSWGRLVLRTMVQEVCDEVLEDLERQGVGEGDTHG
jgi:hypothetical protein